MSVLNTNFTDLAPMIETKDVYIMQGQVFDKTNMKQEFMNFLPVTQSTLYRPSILRRCTSARDTAADCDWHNMRTRGDMFLVDNKDPEVTYAFTDCSDQINNAVIYGRALKIRTSDNYTNIEWNNTLLSTINNGGYTQNHSATYVEIIGQSDKYVYVIVNRSYRDGYWTRPHINTHVIKKIDKISGTSSDVFEYNTTNQNIYIYGVTTKKIYDCEQYFLFSVYVGASNTAYGGLEPGKFYIYKYDKITDTLKRLVVYDKETVAVGENIYASQGFKVDNDIYFYRYTSINSPKIKLYKINTITEEVVETETAVIFNNKIQSLPQTTSTANNHIISVELFIKEHNGKKYINLIGYTTRGITDENNFNKIWTFLIDENSYDLIAQDSCDPFNNNNIRGFVECVDEDLILVSNRVAVKVLRFDINQGKFIEIQTIDVPNNSFGCDSQNNIWISDTSSSLHKFTIDLPSEVRLSFEDDSFDYKGKDLKTNIIVEAINYLDERIELTLDLTIKGPMTFNDGSKATRITTEKDKAVKIPTIVNGSGIISVYPKIIL